MKGLVPALIVLILALFVLALIYFAEAEMLVKSGRCGTPLHVEPCR